VTFVLAQHLNQPMHLLLAEPSWKLAKLAVRMFLNTFITFIPKEDDPNG